MPNPPKTEFPYTNQQWQSLDAERQKVIRSVAEYLSGENLPVNPDDERLSETLNLLRPCQGCVPEEEIDDTSLKAIRKKFAAVYWQGVELASKELQRRGHQTGQDFTFNLIIDPTSDDFTMIVVVDATKANGYLYEGHKAWHFHFNSLADIADAVLSVRNLLVNKVTDRLAKEQEIFVVVQGGRMDEVVNCPSNIRVTVIDYDTEGVEDDRLQKSPLNGLPCCLNRF
jgi:hypothetical protein